MARKIACCAVLLFSLALIVGVPGKVIAEITGIQYRFIYDPLDDHGLLNVEVSVDLPECGFLTVPVAVMGEGSEYALLNYTSSGDVLVGGLNYFEDSGYMELFACGRGTVSALFRVAGVFEEDGVLSYSAVLDTSQLAEIGVPVAVEILIVGNYAVFVEGVGVEVYVDEGRGAIRVHGHGSAFITLQGSLEETHAPSPTETPIATPVETPVHTTAVTPTPTPRATQPQVADTPVQREAPLPGLMLAIIIVAVVAVVVTAFFLVSRRR